MRITTITVTKSRTVNLGNFESAKVEFSATCELDYGENYDGTVSELNHLVDAELAARCPTPSSVKAHAGQNSKLAENLTPTAAPVAPLSPRKRRTKAEMQADAVAEFIARQAAARAIPDGLADVSHLEPDSGGVAIGRQHKEERHPQPGHVPAVGRTVGVTETSVTFPDVQAAVMAYMRSHGVPAMTALIKEVSGTASLISIKPEHYAPLYAAAGGDPLGGVH